MTETTAEEELLVGRLMNHPRKDEIMLLIHVVNELTDYPTIESYKPGLNAAIDLISRRIIRMMNE